MAPYRERDGTPAPAPFLLLDPDAERRRAAPHRAHRPPLDRSEPQHGRDTMQLGRMKDDPKTNMAFVACVRRHPVLYDYTLPGHSSRELQDEAWHRVAMECGDTVGNCKEKWKNLRASLCRHLRQQQTAGPGQRPKKPYYLAEHMEFVVPFTKTRPSLGNISSNAMDTPFDPLDYMDEVKQEVEDDDNTGQNHHQDQSGDCAGSTDDDVVVQNSLGSSWADHGDGPAVLQVLEGHVNPSKKRKYTASHKDHHESLADSADLNFLKSLLPDMALMTARQKNSFKLAVLSAIDKIVYNSPSDQEAERRASQSNSA